MSFTVLMNGENSIYSEILSALILLNHGSTWPNTQDTTIIITEYPEYVWECLPEINCTHALMCNITDSQTLVDSVLARKKKR